MRKLALAALFASSAALAQVAPAPPVGPDNGFFRPTPYNDPSLTRDPVLAARQAAELQARLAAEAAMPVEIPAPPLVMNPAVSAEVETQAAQLEAEAERQRAIAQPQPIAGAFTGLTGNENR